MTAFVCMTLLCLIPKLKIWDIPEARSAHTYPISKGGGIAILAGFLSGYFLWYYFHPEIALPKQQIYALLGILLLAAFCLLDDIRSQNVWLKLTVQIISASLAMTSLELPLLITILLTLNCIIFLNVINFMDGLNGLASLSMIFASAFLWKANADPVICLPLSISLLCFLPWNFPKARLFMGDVGSQSCSLILCLAAGLLISTPLNLSQNPSLRIIFLLPALLSSMIFDVFLTLFIRFRNKESLTQAHNTHLYQLAARSKFLSPLLIALIEAGFVLWGGLVDLYIPLSMILPLLLFPQLVWSVTILRFWKESQKA